MPARYFKTLFIIVILSAVSTPVHGQFVDEFGVRIGGNTSTIVTNYRSVDYQPGFQLAAFTELFQSSIFSMQIEVEYAYRGFSSEMEERGPGSEVINRVDARSTLNYLSVPLLARIRISGDRPAIPYLLVGPRLEYLIGHSTGVWEFAEVTVEDVLADHFARTNVSGMIGTGMAVAAPFGRDIRLEARMTEGLRDLLWEEGTGRARTRSFELSVGVSL